jgi:hypothetical protein
MREGVRAGRLSRLTIAVAGLAAVIAMVVVLAISGANAGRAATGHVHAHVAPAQTSRALAFHDAMRKLWEDHITWTRLAIVCFAAGLPDLQVTEHRLLRNQVDIGNAIKPYYGKAAGNRLSALLKQHILGAVALLTAAKSRDQAQITQASGNWYANGKQIADFLHAANPRQWKRGTMRSMMKAHLDETLSEAQDRLAGDYAQDVRDYEAVHRHILAMADELSAGIIAQFPGRFR